MSIPYTAPVNQDSTSVTLRIAEGAIEAYSRAVQNDATSLTFTIDTKDPTILSYSYENVSDASTLIITFSEAVNISTDNITLIGLRVVGPPVLSGSTLTYSGLYFTDEVIKGSIAFLPGSYHDLALNSGIDATHTITNTDARVVLTPTNPLAALNKTHNPFTFTFNSNYPISSINNSLISVPNNQGNVEDATFSGKSLDILYTAPENQDSTSVTLSINESAILAFNGAVQNNTTTLIFTIDTKDPTITSTSLLTQPPSQEATSFDFVFNFSEAVTIDTNPTLTGFNAIEPTSSDIIIRYNGLSFVHNKDTYQGTITFPANSLRDAAGNTNRTETPYTLTNRNARIVLTSTTLPSNPLNKSNNTFTFEFSSNYPITGVSTDLISVPKGQGTIGAVISSSTTLSIPYTAPADQDSTAVTLSIAEGAVLAYSGTVQNDATSLSFSIDTKEPVIISYTYQNVSDVSTLTINFSETVSISTDTITLTGFEEATSTHSGSTLIYSGLNFTSNSVEGTVDLPTGSYRDLALNNGDAATLNLMDTDAKINPSHPQLFHQLLLIKITIPSLFTFTSNYTIKNINNSLITVPGRTRQCSCNFFRYNLNYPLYSSSRAR